MLLGITIGLNTSKKGKNLKEKEKFMWKYYI
jgi:hypothetical protein